MTPPMAWTPRRCLLDRLPGHLCTRLAPELQHVDLPVGKLLRESGCGNQGFFIRSGIVSVLFSMVIGVAFGLQREMRVDRLVASPH